MREWIRTSKDYWSFGAFVVLLLGLCGGLAKVVADSESSKLENAFQAAVDAVAVDVGHNHVLIDQIDRKLDVIGDDIGRRSDRLEERLDSKIDRVDAKLNELLLRMSTERSPQDQ